MSGVAPELAAALDEHCRQRGYGRLTERGEAPLPEALRLLAREVMTGEPPPPSARRLVELWRPTLDDKVRADLAALGQVLEDQSAYAKAIRRLLHDLDIDPGAEDSGQSDEDPRARATSRTRTPTRARQRAGREGGGRILRQHAGRRGRPGEDEAEGQTAESETEMPGEGGEDDPARPGPAAEHDLRNRPNEPTYPPSPPSSTRKPRRPALCAPGGADAAAPAARPPARPLQTVVGKLANRLQRRLLAKQSRAWEFDLEEGLLDSARLSRGGGQPRASRCPTSARRKPTSATPW